MKTIVARFTEMKKAPTDIINVDGEEVSVNKVEAALKSVGVELRNTTGEFRNLDDVFLELASKWDSLDKMSQRYVATTAAGSRQQSRFIAMMSNYQRTMELAGYATNSAGASQKQFEKTMDSLESKLNRLHDAWEQFTTGIANQTAVKGIVDLLTNLLTTVNNVTDALDPLHTGWSKILAAFLGFKAAKGVVNGVLRGIGTQLGTRSKAGLDEDIADGKQKTAGKNLKGIFFGSPTKEQKQEIENNKYLTKELEKQARIKKQESIHAQKAANEAKKEALETEKAAVAAKKKSDMADERVSNLSEEIRNNPKGKKNKGARELSRAKRSSYSAKSQADKAEKVSEKANAAAKEAEAKASEKAKAAIEAETKAQEQKVKTQKLENVATSQGLLTKTKYYIKLLFGKKATRQDALESLNDAAAKGAQAGATEGASFAQGMLNKAMLACPVGWILAGIAAIVAAVMIFAKIHETAAEKVERLNETVNGLGEQMNETQEAIRDMNDSWSNLAEARKTLDSLTIGTIEWKEKLLEVNKQVLDLINKYPELSGYIERSSTGALNITEEGLNVVLETQSERLQEQQIAQSFSQGLKTDMQATQLKENYKYGIVSSEKYAQDKFAKELERDTYISTGTSFLTDSFSEQQKKIGDVLTDEEKNIIASSAATEEILNNFDKIKSETAVDVKKYAELTGLTQEEVKKKKENEELTDDQIKSLIAGKKLQSDFNVQAKNMLKVLRENKLNDFEKRAISGVNTFTRKDLNNKDAGEVFRNFIINGKIEINGEEGETLAKEKLLSNFPNFTEDNLNALLKAGYSIENIIQNLLNSSQSLEKIDDNLSQLSEANRTAATSFFKKIQKTNKDIPTDQLEKISSVFLEIGNRGGNIEEFSKQLELIIGRIEKPEDLNNFLSSLKDVDFSSESKIKNFTDGLERFGVTLSDTVEEELIDATNAARDFDLSNFSEQLKQLNYALISDLKEREKEQNKIFSDKDIDDYKEKLADFPELLAKFQQFGENFVYMGELSELINALDNTKIISDTTKRLQDENKDEQEAFKKYEEARSKYGTSSEKYGAVFQDKVTPKVFSKLDFREEFMPNVPTDVIKRNIESLGQKELQDYFLNNLLYKQDENGNFVVNADGEKVFDNDKIVSVLKKAKENAEFGVAVPQAFYDAIKKQVERQENGEFHGEGLYTLDHDFEKLITETQASVQDALTNDIEGKLQSNFYVDAGEGARTALLKNYQKILGDKILSNETIKKLAKLSDEKIQEEIQKLLPSQDKDTLNAKLESAEEGHIQSLTSAREILSFNSQTEKGMAAQEKAIDAVVFSIDNYNERLRQIREEQGLSIREAKKYLAVQDEQIKATDQIYQILSDHKESLSADNIESLKGTPDYIEGIAELTKQFKILFGEDITSEWVEKNLDNIRKLSDKGTREAAFQSLVDTDEAKWFTLDVSKADADGEKIEDIWSSISLAITNVADNIEKDKDVVSSSIEAINTALTDLDGSTASIEIKNNTRAAALESIESSLVAMSSLYYNALASNNYKKAYEIASMMNDMINMATSHGFSIPGLKINTNYKVQEKEFYYSVSGAKDFMNNGKVIDLEGTKMQLEVTSDESGSGQDTNSGEDNDKKKDTTTKEWVNDYDKLYNVQKRITALQEKQNKLEKERNRIIKQRYIDEKALAKNKKEQIDLLKRQAVINADLANSAESYLRGSGNGDVWYDEELGTIQTNPNAAYYDEEQKKAFDAQLKMMEDYLKQRDDANKNLENIYEAIDELTKIAEFSVDNFTNSIDSIIKVLDNTSKNLEREISRLNRYDSGVTAEEYKTRYEQSAQIYADKYNQLTNKKAINEQALNNKIYSDYGKYLNVDWNSKEVTETSLYYSITDPDIKKSVDEFINDTRDLADKIIDIDDQQEEIRDSLYELQQTLADKSLEFQEKVYDAVIKSREDEITTLNTINDSIKDAASELISSIQKNIQKIRQERSNKKTEEELSKMQSRLDFLRMDTSSGNQKAILDLEKQLEDKEESYTDALIDQKISELQDQNTEAEKQRKRQIEIMETQLELSKENGAIWKAVDDAIKTGFNSSGRIQKGSDLYNMLSSLDEVTKKNSVQFERWFGELNNLAAAYNANLTADLDTSGQMSNTVSNANDVYGENSEYIKSLKSRLEAMNRDGNFNHLMWYDQEGQKMVYKYSHYYASSETEAENYNKKVAEYQALARELANARAFYKNNKNASFTSAFNRLYGYDTGGLADYTGFAWLDGTPTSPEMVLSSKDTENFIQLKDILSNVMNGEVNKNNGTNGDYYFEIAINVDKVTNDYDVDQIADRIKQQISDSARYRNVNVINLLR